MSTTSLEALEASIIQRQPFCSGTIPLSPKNAVIFYKDGVNSNWIDMTHPADDALQSLAKACNPATFGANKRDVLDESYRKAGKMDNNDFATTFDLGQTHLLDMIRAQLLPEAEGPKSINAELYKLNVYGKGSFFKAHMDTPRGETMFGSLVVVYPTQHEGGTLILRHGGKEWTFDSAEAIRKHDVPTMAYVALFGDVEHEVAVVTSGYRVTLTFNLYFTGEDTLDSLGPAIMPGFEAAFTAALYDPAFLPNGGLLGFGLTFKYPCSPGTTNLHSLLRRLKGSDAVIKQVCDRLSLDASLKAISDMDEYTGEDNEQSIMLDHIPDLSSYGTIDEEISSFICTDFEGQVIYNSGNKAPKKHPDAVEILWVTPLTDIMNFKSPYVRYGNEATLGYIYGDVCLIAEVGPVHQRSTVAT